MDAEARLKSKRLYKLVIIYLRIIPGLLAVCTFLDTLTQLLGYTIVLFSMIGGISFLTLAFLYMASYVFHYCKYHRMFLHYVLVNNILSFYEEQFGLPVSFNGLIAIFSVVACVFLFFILYYYKKEKC